MVSFSNDPMHTAALAAIDFDEINKFCKLATRPCSNPICMQDPSRCEYLEFIMHHLMVWSPQEAHRWMIEDYRPLMAGKPKYSPHDLAGAVVGIVSVHNALARPLPSLRGVADQLIATHNGTLEATTTMNLALARLHQSLCHLSTIVLEARKLTADLKDVNGNREDSLEKLDHLLNILVDDQSLAPGGLQAEHVFGLSETTMARWNAGAKRRGPRVIQVQNEESDSEV